MSEARRVALDVLYRVREQDAYANLVLPDAIGRAGLDSRDAAFVTELAYGTLRRLGTLDWVISLHSSRRIEEIDGVVLDALRLGVYQILETEVPDHAAVGETVQEVPLPVRGFVNAILRKVASGRDDIPWPDPETDLVSALALRHAHPAWIVRMWLDELGPRATEALLRANNDVPPTGVRANPVRTTPSELQETFTSSGLTVRRSEWAPDVLLVSGGGHPTSWPGFSEGAFAVQDPASVLAGAAAAEVGARVAVDLCAGPGGKSGQLAVSAERLVACEPHHNRARLVAQTLDRLGVDDHTVVVQADGRRPPVRDDVDCVLVDAPCTGLGVLRRRPEARWRVSEADIARSAHLQTELVEAAFDLVRPGGRLVYAVCTVSLAETSGVVDRLLDRRADAHPLDVHPDIPRIDAGPALQLLPSVHATDGMFVACVERRG